MEVDRGIKLEERESKDFVYGGLKLKKEYERCISCLELYDKITKADNKCARLELDIRKKNSAIESLEGKLGFMEHENLKIKDEVRVLKQRNEELEKSIRDQDREEEDDKLTLLMIENKVLECEKKKAEIEIDAWKVKCEELEMKVMELEKRLSAGMMKTGGPSEVQTQNKANEDKNASGTPTIKQYTQFEGFKGCRGCELKSSLDFAGEGSPRKNISPSTPGIKRPFVPIEISDSDDDLNSKNVQSSTGVGLGVTPDENEFNSKDRFAAVVEDHSDEEKTTFYIARPPNVPIPKKRKVRREVAYVVSSESESDSDDNIPICRLGSKNNRKKHTPKRRLKRVGENKSTGDPKRLGTPKDDSGSEGESLGGFIVDSSDDSESDSVSNSDDDMSENEGTFSGVAYDEVMSGLRRERKDKMNWEYEADMLADLAKCPELCMKAVCAIYRRQTSEEKSRQVTLFLNRRGFSQIDASSGSDLAEFLTDGNPQGVVKKTVEELKEFDSEGVEECRNLATHYSRQLFEIYKNHEDPFFHP